MSRLPSPNPRAPWLGQAQAPCLNPSAGAEPQDFRAVPQARAQKEQGLSLSWPSGPPQLGSDCLCCPHAPSHQLRQPWGLQ